MACMALLPRGTALPEAMPQECCAVRTVTHVYQSREGEETMPIYRVMLKEPTTPHEPLLIRAPVARVAQRAAICMLHALLPKAAQGATLNLDPDLTTCVQVHDSGYPEEGPLEILEPVHH
jgi:hypothetical protein